MAYSSVEMTRKKEEELMARVRSYCRLDPNGGLVRGMVTSTTCQECGEPRFSDGTYCDNCGSYAVKLPRPKKVCQICGMVASAHSYGLPVCPDPGCKSAAKRESIRLKRVVVQ